MPTRSAPTWLPCSVCGRYAGEWRRGQSARWTVTAPEGVRVRPGEPWTCRLCVRLGHEQVAAQRAMQTETKR